MKKNVLKKICAVALLVLCTCFAFAACEDKEDAADENVVGGTVATDGSTSMEKVIGSLGEAYMAQNPDVTFTYNPTGSGSGITAVISVFPAVH